jgi:hypothetical protein
MKKLVVERKLHISKVGEEVFKKKAFQLYNDNGEIFNDLSDEEAGKLIKAVFAHETGKDFKLDGVLKTLFIPIRQQLDRDREKYFARCESSRENGKKGGRPPSKAKVIATGDGSSNNPRGFLGSTTKPRKPDKDTETDTVKVTEKELSIGPDLQNCSEDPYQSLFDHYNSLNLIHHKGLTKEMRNAIDLARRRGDYDWPILLTLLDRHSKIVEMTAGNGEFRVRPRPIAEFFGQKVKDGTALICSGYADDGSKWLRYLDGKYQRRHVKKVDDTNCKSWERPTRNYDHLAEDLFTGKYAPNGTKTKPR